MTDNYFAYGSNMAPARLEERDVVSLSRRAGTLRGWRLVFDKRSGADPAIGFANVTPDPDSSVEGVLYELAPHGIERLDVFEHAPDNYERSLYDIDTDDGPVSAWVYVATEPWRSPGLTVRADYLRYLVDGADLLSDDYRRQLEDRLRAARVAEASDT